ncbi:MAG: tetratricopeptide repeat protein [Candidatus Kariarchaeaceae archaeon]
MIELPPELFPHLLDLSSDEKKHLIELARSCETKRITFSDWTECLLKAYQNNKLVLTPGIVYLVTKVAFYSLNYDLVEELVLKKPTMGGKLWLIERIMHKSPEEALDELNAIDENSLPLLEKAEWFNKKIHTLYLLDNYLESIKTAEEAFLFLETIIDSKDKDFVHQVLLFGYYYSHGRSVFCTGDVQKAIELTKAGIKKAEDYQDKIQQGHLLNHLAIINHQTGKYAQSVEIYEKAYSLLMEVGDHRTAQACRGNQGCSLINQGRYSEAITILEENYSYWKEIDQIDNQIYIGLKIGKALKGLGELERAVEYAHEALELHNKQGYNSISDILEAGSIYLEADKLVDCKNCINRVERLITEGMEYFALLTKILKGGLNLKKSNIGVAEELLETAHKNALKTDFIQLILHSLFLLAELSIHKYSYTHSEEDISRAEERITDLNQLLLEIDAGEQSSKLLLIRSTLAAKRLDNDLAMELIDEALAIATRDNFKEVINRANQLKKDLRERFGLTQKESMQEEIDQKNETLSELVETYRSLSAREFAQTQKEPEIIAFSITRSQGLPLLSINFGEEEKKSQHNLSNSLLISGFLKAITEFSNTIFGTKKGMKLRTIAYNNYSIMVEIHQEMIYALYVEEETFQLRHKLRSIAEKVSKMEIDHSNVIIKSDLKYKITQEVNKILEN